MELDAAAAADVTLAGGNMNDMGPNVVDSNDIKNSEVI